MERISAAEFQNRYGNNHRPRPRVRSTKPKEQAPALGHHDAGKTQSAGRPVVRFTLLRIQLLDADAKHGTLKDLLDGCVYAGLIPGDREDQIVLEVDQRKVDHRNEQDTLLSITYP